MSAAPEQANRPAASHTTLQESVERSGTITTPRVDSGAVLIDQPEKAEKYELPQAWAHFLGQPALEAQWSWYGHFTHKGYPHPEAFDKLWKRWLYGINVEAYGKRYWKRNRGVTWARASERQARGSLHYHALLGDIPSWVDKAYHYRRWEGMSGFCRIERFEPNRGAEYYMSKDAYAWKDGDIDVSANLSPVLANSKRSAIEEERVYVKGYLDCRQRKELSSFAW